MYEIFVIVFGAIVLFLLALGAALDMAARIEYAESIFPWLKRWTDNRKWQRILLLCTMLFYGGTLYELLKEPQQCTLPAQNAGAVSVVSIVRENEELKAELAPLTRKEDKNSLRRRTIRLAAELDKFWNEMPPPPPQPSPFPQTDEDKKKTETWKKFWVDIQAKYDSHAFREKTLEIIKQYQNLGIPTSFLENSARDRMVSNGYPGVPPQPSNDIFCQTDTCELRELAFHVNAQDGRITTDF